jgi:hypothetical protein
LKASFFLMAFYQIMYITLAGDGLTQCFFFWVKILLFWT